MKQSWVSGNSAAISTIGFVFGMMVSFVLNVITKYWEATGKNYLRTMKNITHGWRLSDEEFKGMMGIRYQWPITGYCELQWIYLGMKEYWLEEEFFEMKKRLTNNKLPNF